MLRSPTHIVGHGPTSSPSSTTTTTTALNGASNGNSSPNGNTNRLLRSGSGGAHHNGTATQQQQTPTRTSLFDSCHRKIRLIGGGPVAFLGGLVAKARRKERDGDQSATDTKLYLEESVLERKLPDADLRDLVDLPAGLDYNEWLASHTLALFEHVNLVYGTISEFCTTSGCPDMTGPGNRTYLWFDEKGKKTRVAAPQYIDYVMTFTQKTVSDESIFPTKFANEFPSSFESIARKILRLQFHVIAHLYAAHFREIATLGLHTHLNLTFAHLTALHRRFNLIDEKETDVLRDLEIALRLTDDDRTSSTSVTTAMTTSSTDSPKTMTGTMLGSSMTGSSICAAATCSSTSSTSSSAATTTTSNIMTNNQGTEISGSKILGNNTSTTTSDNSGLIHQQQQRTSSSSSSSMATTATSVVSTTAIDGDATIRPICTQPEAMRGMCDHRAERRCNGSDGSVDGIGGIGVGVGCVGSSMGIGRYHPGYCGNSTINNNNNSNNQTGINWTTSSNSSSVGVTTTTTTENDLNSSHIGNNVFGYSNTNVNRNSSTHSITTNSLLQQCNSNSRSSSSRNNSHTTTA